MLEKVEANTIVISSVAKTNTEILVSWSMVEVPEGETLDVVNFVASNFLVDCVLIVFQVETVVDFESWSFNRL